MIIIVLKSFSRFNSNFKPPLLFFFSSTFTLRAPSLPYKSVIPTYLPSKGQPFALLVLFAGFVKQLLDQFSNQSTGHDSICQFTFVFFFFFFFLKQNQ